MTEEQQEDAAGEVNNALEHIKLAIGSLAAEYGNRPEMRRAAACAVTKLDEAQLWLARMVSEAAPGADEHRPRS